jgi:hypothetical protein
MIHLLWTPALYFAKPSAGQRLPRNHAVVDFYRFTGGEVMAQNSLAEAITIVANTHQEPSIQ